MANTVGTRVKFAREQKGWTQEQLGEQLGVDRTHVSKWETDQVAPRGSARLRLANALGVSAEWIRTGEGPMAIPALLAEMASAAKTVTDLRRKRDGLKQEVSDQTKDLLTTALELVIDVAREHQTVLTPAQQSHLAVFLARQADHIEFTRESIWGLIQLAITLNGNHES